MFEYKEIARDYIFAFLNNSERGEKLVEKDSKEYRIRVGKVVIGLDCPSPAYAASMKEYFGVKSTKDDPHICLKLKVVTQENIQDIPDSLFTTKIVNPEGFSIAGDLVSGRFLPEKREGEVSVKCILTKGLLTRVFEQLIYQAFYSARKVCNYDAFLIHSSGVIRDSSGFLFVGASGTGKTTIARLSSGDPVLNEEICLISFNKEGVLLHGTPFNGYFKKKSEGSISLKAVLILAQGSSHRLREMNRAEAVVALTPEIVPPVGLEEELTQRTHAAMLELADRLSRLVPVWRLEFLPDTGFWNEIDREFLLSKDINNG